jgi:hypothetical protein
MCTVRAVLLLAYTKQTASDWLLIKQHVGMKVAGSSVTKLIGLYCISYRSDFSIYWKEDVLCQLKIRGASEKLKNQPRPLLRPSSVNFSQQFLNLSCKTVSLNSNKLFFE